MAESAPQFQYDATENPWTNVSENRALGVVWESAARTARGQNDRVTNESQLQSRTDCYCTKAVLNTAAPNQQDIPGKGHHQGLPDAVSTKDEACGQGLVSHHAPLPASNQTENSIERENECINEQERIGAVEKPELPAKLLPGGINPDDHPMPWPYIIRLASMLGRKVAENRKKKATAFHNHRQPTSREENAQSTGTSASSITLGRDGDSPSNPETEKRKFFGGRAPETPRQRRRRWHICLILISFGFVAIYLAVVLTYRHYEPDTSGRVSITCALIFMVPIITLHIFSGFMEIVGEKDQIGDEEKAQGTAEGVVEEKGEERGLLHIENELRKIDKRDGIYWTWSTVVNETDNKTTRVLSMCYR